MEEERASARASDLRGNAEGFLAEGRASGSSLGGSAGPRTEQIGDGEWSSTCPARSARSKGGILTCLDAPFTLPVHPGLHESIAIRCLLYSQAGGRGTSIWVSDVLVSAKSRRHRRAGIGVPGSLVGQLCPWGRWKQAMLKDWAGPESGSLECMLSRKTWPRILGT